MSYLDELKKATNKTYTQNGATTNQSTLDPVLDFFSMAGAMRNRKDEAVKLFKQAYSENPLLALKALFYLRDIRGGQGERDLFRACIKELPIEIIKKNLENIPEYGRYDDLFSLDINIIEYYIREQLIRDTEAMNRNSKVSLLAKWMPSENTSSKKTKELARKLAKAIYFTPRHYRKTIVSLRKYIKILEQKMSANKWGEIDYETTPAQAMRKHIKAFKKHDEDRYSEYLADVNKGEKKIKTSTLFTYEVFDTVSKDEETANIMWDNLPDYTNGNNALVIADVSGSMIGRPMSISVSLALYFAERNKGLFNGYFMTFSRKPQLVKVRGNRLAEKLRNIENADWGMNTDVEAAFMAILEAAKNNKAEPDEMPKVLYIISDMEFDSCSSDKQTNFENAKTKFEEAGYKLPHLVFWNVNSKSNQTPATKYDNFVTLISGSSQSTFRYAVEGKSPLESMNEILNSERYSKIRV